ncbi:alanine racemase [Thermoproteota archaeon]
MTKKVLTRPLLQINLNAVKENYQFLKTLCAPAECSAVVKNNAYGLGVREIVTALKNVGCKTFWTAHAHEGAEIRALIPDCDIIVLQGPCQDTIQLFQDYHLIPVINTLDQLEYWEANKTDNAKPFVLHIDTGLNRYGLRTNDIKRLSSQLNRLNDLYMVISHLACADDNGHFMNNYQQKQFTELCACLPKVKKSLSASDGAFLGNEFSYDMVRLGAALFGINTAPYRENQMKNVISIQAPVLQIEELPLGQYCGYGAAYRAHTTRRLAVISIGYGDGIPCSLRNVGWVWFQDKNDMYYEARITGRISMDIITCDITDIPRGVVQTGTQASLVNERYTVDDLGRDAGTIGYEVISRLGKRFKRVYLD